MATFYDNLRASRTGNRQVSNSLPTRGDMQKERQKQSSVSPDSFINFLRGVLGLWPAVRGKEQLNIEDVPASNMDRMSPDDAQQFNSNRRDNAISANNGTLNLENDLNKYNPAVNGTLDVPYGHSDFEKAYGILENYDALNNVLDEYDAINTWAGKRRYLQEAYKRFNSNDNDITKWFNRLYDYTEQAQDFGEWDTKAVTNVMRQINDNVKNRLLRKI